MVATYDDAGDTYEQALWTYDGYLLTAGITELLLDGVGVPEMAYDGPTLAVSTDLEQLGTLDVTLNDAAIPALGQALAVYMPGPTLVWDGAIASVETDEFKAGYTFSKVSAQQAAFPGGTPSAAPWNVSDTPNLTTTFPYVRLSQKKRNTEGVAVTGYELVVDKTGLWRNMTVQVTAANFGLSAQTFLIVAVNLEWQTKASPRYTLQLDVSQPQLPELISDQAALVLETGTVHYVQNVPATVTVNDTGLQVTNGSIQVINPAGTVIIDGTSNMFKIIASGTFVVVFGASAMGVATSLDLSALGTFTETPAHFAWITPDGAATSRRQGTPYITESGSVKFAALSSGGAVTSPSGTFDYLVRTYTLLDASGFLSFKWEVSNATAGAANSVGRFYILKEVAY